MMTEMYSGSKRSKSLVLRKTKGLFCVSSLDIIIGFAHVGG